MGEAKSGNKAARICLRISAAAARRVAYKARRHRGPPHLHVKNGRSTRYTVAGDRGHHAGTPKLKPFNLIPHTVNLKPS